MNKKLLLFSAFMAGASWTVQAQDLVLSEGQYYTDATQTTPYTGRYTEFYDDGMLKMELYLKDGRPEGTYVIYYPSGKIAEVRSYYHGIFHGEWRTYNENGQLIGLASYKEGQKDGPWRIREICCMRCSIRQGRNLVSGVAGMRRGICFPRRINRDNCRLHTVVTPFTSNGKCFFL